MRIARAASYASLPADISIASFAREPMFAQEEEDRGWNHKASCFHVVFVASVYPAFRRPFHLGVRFVEVPCFFFF